MMCECLGVSHTSLAPNYMHTHTHTHLRRAELIDGATLGPYLSSGDDECFLGALL